MEKLNFKKCSISPFYIIVGVIYFFSKHMQLVSQIHYSRKAYKGKYGETVL